MIRRRNLMMFLAFSLLTVDPLVYGQASKTRPSKKRPARTATTNVLRPTLPANLMLYDLVKVSNLWIRDGRLNVAAHELRTALNAAPRHGLPSRDYWTASLEELYNKLAALPPLPPAPPAAPAPLVSVATGAELPVTPATPEPVPSVIVPPAEKVLADKFESEATAALLKYASHLSIGRINPSSLGDDVKVPRKTFALETLADVLKATTGSLSQNLDSLAPRWAEYLRLQNALDRLSRLNPDADFPKIVAPRKNLKVNDRDAAVVPPLKTRLRTLGYHIAFMDESVDTDLVAQVRRYLLDHGLSGNGDLTRNSPLWKHIGIQLEARLQQIRMTMEKIRWFPQSPESRYALNNIAMQNITVFEGSNAVLRMKTINGRSERPTPTLRDRLFAVELNPDWRVPVRLFIEDKLPIIQQDPWFFYRNGYVVYERGREVNPGYISWDWLSEDEIKNLSLRQLPGTGNALGVMKFHLSNGFAIYLHDTNERHLFSSRHRLMSSGCVRLERPLDMAAYLLAGHPRWGDAATIKANLATERVARRNVPLEHVIRLDQALPTYLVYWTVHIEEDGRILFASDYYRQDTRLFEQLRRSRASF